ncbi:reverse transcriptase [Apiospora kogelbergensis]|uniref:reverse transcriptase n=1 Tax=Apiospora kogelbergensis TaxID=1337665 RepID=UPI00312CD270
MTPPASVLSRTLQSISITKIREIEKQRVRYEKSKQDILAKADQFPNDPRKRIAVLLKGLGDVYQEALYDNKVNNIKHWLQQAIYDASVPADMLKGWEELVRSKLQVQSRKLGLAYLYTRLVTEWMNPTAPMSRQVAPVADEEDSFEVVDRQKERLQELCDKFERVVFEPLETDEVEIDMFLADLFDGDEATKSLQGLRTRLEQYGDSVMTEKNPFTSDCLKWCLRGLLAEDLLSEEKQATLRDFLDNEAALKEIGDVLNMRYADFDSWEWQAGEDGIPVLPRQQLNGKYRIWMDEDVLQAIFVEFVGIRCCNLARKHLTNFVEFAPNWKWTSETTPSKTEQIRRDYYVQKEYHGRDNVYLERKQLYLQHFLLSQLPKTVQSLHAGSYDGVPDDDGMGKAPFKNIKQALLRTIATETLLSQAQHGEVVVLQSDLQWYATGLSHSTIFAVMRFFGFSTKLINFYKKVLEAPLNISPATDGVEPKGPKIRRRGVPMAHATEKFIGELILFAMDIVVNKASGLLLYRLHDDLFLAGRPSDCTKAWKAMQEFAKVMGLEFNEHKTGSVYLVNEEKSRDPGIESILPKGPVEIGHLLLDPKSGEWIIDQKQVDIHITQLEKQLAACDSILTWVQTWNSCIGRFFSHTFGEPAFCFGTKHIDSILETYQRMQAFLFSPSNGHNNGGSGNAAEPGNVVQYLKAKMEERFGITDIPNAFVFLPSQLGGLGVRNPIVSLQMFRRDLSLCESPHGQIKNWLAAEEQQFADDRKAFYELQTVEDRLRRLRHRSDTTDDYTAAKDATRAALSDEELATFFSFDEYRSRPETTSRLMSHLYRKLASTPKMIEPELDMDVRCALMKLGLDDKPQAAAAETRWALQMFCDELRDTYGGLNLVDEKYLTLGILTMMRSKAVRWNMVL